MTPRSQNILVGRHYSYVCAATCLSPFATCLILSHTRVTQMHKNLDSQSNRRPIREARWQCFLLVILIVIVSKHSSSRRSLTNTTRKPIGCHGETTASNGWLAAGRQAVSRQPIKASEQHNPSLLQCRMQTMQHEFYSP